MRQFVGKKRPLHTDDAISPVIGVILMVAITVILSAVIAGFVMGMPSYVQKPWQVGVGVDVKRIPGDIIGVTIYGGDDFTRLISIKGSVNGDFTACNELSASTTPPLKVGSEMQCSGAIPGSDHIIVVGRFNDGSDQVLIESII